MRRRKLDPGRRFRWLMWLLPTSFREDHGPEILDVWRQDLRDGRRGVWRAAALDTLKVAPRERCAAWIRDCRFAARRLRRAPGFAFTAVITLALGTGAAASVFSLVNGVLLRPLPWHSPETVGLVWPVQPSGARTWLSYPELQDLRRDAPELRSVAGLADLRVHATADGAGLELQALAVSHDLFRLLGVAPIAGRTFLPDDDRPGAANVAVLSHGFWRNQFGGDLRIVGQSIRLNDRDYTVVGVLPAGFSVLPASSVFPDRVDAWLPLEPHLVSRDRTIRFLHVLARVDSTAQFARAADDLRAYAERAHRAFPAAYPGGSWTFTVVPFAGDVLRSAQTALTLMFGLVVLVLLMACTNVANLLLARGAGRRHELAVCTALGAGRGRLAGELLAEALILSVCGTALGLTVAVAAPHVLRTIDPGALPRLDEAQLDARVAGFAVALVGLSVAIFAGAPLVERLKTSPAAVISGRTGGRSRRRTHLGRTLVFVQTALATTVIITTLFLRESFDEQHRAPLGFDTAHFLTARVTLSPKYPTGAAAAQFFDRAVDAAKHVPGVTAAAAISQLPLSGAMLSSTFLVPPEGGEATEQRVDADLRSMTEHYFRVAGAPLLEGRAFSSDDTGNSADVAIVDASFARRLRPDGRVVGRRIRWLRRPDRDVEIVGVVGPVRHRGPADPPRETVYRPHRQLPRTTMFVAVRTIVDPEAITSGVRAAIADVDPLQPFVDVLTMDERLSRVLSGARTSLMLAGVLAGIALTLALVGLYGVLSFDVAQRVREFGVRMALGAHPAGIRGLVLREGAVLTLCGAAAGVAAAALVVRAIQNSLYGTDAGSVRQYLLGVAVILLCSALAYWLPARRASAVDPLTALRAD